jgi:hypothetical protein
MENIWIKRVFMRDIGRMKNRVNMAKKFQKSNLRN